MGLIAANISALIVLAFLCLVILAVILMGVGAYESATNPHIAQDTAQEYAQGTAEYQPCTGRDLRRGGQCDRWIIVTVVCRKHWHFC